MTHDTEARPSADELRVVVESQPRLYIEAMLDDYDSARTPEAKEAILTRLGAVLLSTYGVTPTLRAITTEPWKPRWEMSAVEVSWKPESATLRDVFNSWWRAGKGRRKSGT